MNVAFRLSTRCLLCGCRCTGVVIRPMRVGATTMRSTGPGLGLVSRRCPECSGPTQDPHRWDTRLAPAEQERVAAAMASHRAGRRARARKAPARTVTAATKGDLL